ncbi:ATP phosphoribosyltransferase [Oceanobacillus picturae]|uniref:ATP phosphoribosyltransferase n=2 Tax=Oceanobacillus TaxID=182709 RepID=W9AN07_9BACI|nr:MULTISPECIES: ATP phosphoribosyltransferase [Oceanobacillus]MCG3419305.1 ATP phosphoribosyltransferase [Oceanobacillus jordanicus]RIU88556.1 ATP phosphoribosyltransferase [Oceanobacillus picturae]CDO04036.1 ATP phosphoribosyltransferase [Oceanobacillus picturae]
MSNITLALAKGRTADSTIHLLKKIGIQFQDFHEDTRKLVFLSEDASIKLIFVKAVDVPTYVEKGAADIGIAGKDNILESQADVYELLDLKIGQCKFVVAGRAGDFPPSKQRLTVASKYPNITEQHFQKKGLDVETVKLNGSVELAPLIGLADVIVDIVETGNTLKENGLEVFEDVENISTRLIVNKASFATKSNDIQLFIKRLTVGLEEEYENHNG